MFTRTARPYRGLVPQADGDHELIGSWDRAGVVRVDTDIYLMLLVNVFLKYKMITSSPTLLRGNKVLTTYLTAHEYSN